MISLGSLRLMRDFGVVDKFCFYGYQEDMGTILFDGYYIETLDSLDDDILMFYIIDLDIKLGSLEDLFFELRECNIAYKKDVNYTNPEPNKPLMSYNPGWYNIEHHFFALLQKLYFFKIYESDEVLTLDNNSLVMLDGNTTDYKKAICEIANKIENEVDYILETKYPKMRETLIPYYNKKNLCYIDEDGVRIVNNTGGMSKPKKVVDIVPMSKSPEWVDLLYKDGSKKNIKLENYLWLLDYYSKFLTLSSGLLDLIEDAKVRLTMESMVGNIDVRCYGLNIPTHYSTQELILLDLLDSDYLHMNTKFGDIYILRDAESNDEYNDKGDYGVCAISALKYIVEDDSLATADYVDWADMEYDIPIRNPDNLLNYIVKDIHSIVVDDDNIELNILCFTSVNSGSQAVAKVPLGMLGLCGENVGDFVKFAVGLHIMYVHRNILKHHSYNSRFKNCLNCFGDAYFNLNVDNFYDYVITTDNEDIRNMLCTIYKENM